MNFLTLFQLNSLIKKSLSAHLEPSYWVVAEIGELRVDRNGHCYIELVEKSDDKLIAKVRATIWAGSYRKLAHYFESVTGQTLKHGMKVLMNGSVNFHEMYGLSFNIKEIDPNYTLGERARRRQEIIGQLLKDGIFDMNRTNEFPLVPQRIAVVSSPGAAGLGDFMDQLENNVFKYRYDIQLFTATMQGESAPKSMILALSQIKNIAEKFDVVTIIRGGGAQVDLDCFDHYELASFVATFPLPVVTGIGHERDETIVDLVAHSRLKTPTAVAEFLINKTKIFEENIEQVVHTMATYTKGILETYHLKLHHLLRRFHSATALTLNKNHHRLESLGEKVSIYPQKNIEKREEKLQALKEAITRNHQASLQREQGKLQLLEKTVNLLNPSHILKRGYTISYHQNELLKNTMGLKENDEIKTFTDNQVIFSTIKSVQEK